MELIRVGMRMRGRLPRSKMLLTNLIIWEMGWVFFEAGWAWLDELEGRGP